MNNLILLSLFYYGGPDLPVVPDPDYLGMVPDDRAYDDWLREQERRYWGWGDYGIYYEGYPQYGPSGESIYDYRTRHGGVPQ